MLRCLLVVSPLLPSERARHANNGVTVVDGQAKGISVVCVCCSLSFGVFLFLFAEGLTREVK